MDNKTVRLVEIENQVDINKDSQAEFLFQYQKAILLTLSEQGIINKIQCQQCIDKLIEQLKKTIPKILIEI
ncbi:MAG: hypothetical protein PHV32_02605 [Eubacteriales bacterium]|nr:hypothetical protein [Eubacteriales bacterium]